MNHLLSWIFGDMHKDVTEFFKKLLFSKTQISETPSEHTVYPKCNCFNEYYTWSKQRYSVKSDNDHKNPSLVWSESTFHVEKPSNSQRAWDIVCEIIEKTAKTGMKELNLGKIMDRPDYMELNTLPESIGELKDLETLILYGSNLTSIPREISGCVNLNYFDPYTSSRLHWFPYEIKRCRKLTDSCISTRILYGNYKLRPPFPDLSTSKWEWNGGRKYCSICNTESDNLDTYWISQVVATDVIPLLVSVCSKDCLEKVGKSADGYFQGPHKGGLKLEQPSADWMG
jgi:hypothetical protein